MAKKSDKAGKKAALDAAIAAVDKRYGEQSAIRMDGSSVVDGIDVIPTGSLALDLALGVGGYPRGRMVEIYGPEASGKTTLALHAIAQCHALGGAAVMIDVEHALNIEYAKHLGVRIDVKDNPLVISQPNSGDEALEIMETFISSGAIDLVVLDSVAALVPRAELQGDMGDSHVALQARLMSQATRKLTGVIGQTKTCAIFINQIRMKVGVMYGNPEVTPGGRALKFYASQRVEVRSGAKIEVEKKGKKIRIGNEIKMKVVKNKMAMPFRVAHSMIRFNEGIDVIFELASLGVSLNVIERKGTAYHFDGDRLAVGRNGLEKALRESEDLRTKVREAIEVAYD